QRTAVRVLPERPDHDRGGAARERPGSVGRRHRQRAGRQPVPVRDLRPDPRRRARGREDRRCAMNPRMRKTVLATLGVASPPPEPSKGLRRRSFLQVMASATGGLVLASQLRPLARAAGAPPAPPAPPPSLFVRIDPDNRVTVMIPKSE